MSSTQARETVSRLAARSKVVTEAELQADLAALLLCGDLDLQAEQLVRREAQVGDGTRRRIDVEVGQAVFEVKKDLRVGSSDRWRGTTRRGPYPRNLDTGC